MLELEGVAGLFRGAAVLYWVSALVALVLAISLPKKPWHRIAAAAAVLALFGYLPVSQFIAAEQRKAFAREAWAYFRKKCETEAGQRIYRTSTGVKSVLIVNPLPAATETDLLDQYWFGDPYSNASAGPDRGLLVAGRLVGPGLNAKGKRGRGFSFVEVRASGASGYLKVTRSDEPPYFRHVEPVEKPVSRFGLSWEDISTPEDRKYWVAASWLRVIDLSTNAIVAERIGFLIEPGFGSRAGQRSPWSHARLGADTSCPDAHDHADRWFVLAVLRP